MGVWDTYKNRLEVRGSTRRDAAYEREKRKLENRLQEN